MGSRIRAFAVAAGLCIAGVAVPADLAVAGGGNSDNAEACQKGGWQELVREDLAEFANQGDCVSYAAQGGRVGAITSQSWCEDNGGRFTNNPILGPTLWDCFDATWQTGDDAYNTAKDLCKADVETLYPGRQWLETNWNGTRCERGGDG
jgi:hypothetical protein